MNSIDEARPRRRRRRRARTAVRGRRRGGHGERWVPV